MSVSGSAGNAIIPRRGNKANRGSGNYTGNLVVYSQGQRGKGTIVRGDGYNVDPAVSNSAARLELTNSVSVIDEPVGKRSGTSTQASWFGLSAIAILVAIATGTVIGSFGSTVEIDPSPPTAAENFVVDSAQAATEDTTAEQPQGTSSLQPQIDNATASTEAPDALPSDGNVEAEDEELDTARLMAKEYLEEIIGLKSQNDSLQAEAAELNDETVELNKELLGLELAMSAAESESSPVTETRVIYNIVNVPVGDQAVEVEGTTLPLDQYEEDTDLPLEQYDERDVIYPDPEEQITSEAIPFEKLQEDQTDSYNDEPIRWDNSGESVEFIDAYPAD
ncbi:hypothetical protein N9383_02565 [Granulosicoccus sp.]|nr:hypothetical protein [Granulosicoccus sp.]